MPATSILWREGTNLKNVSMYLNCKSWFSFHFGTIRTETLVKRAAELGIETMALTNINNTCDTWDFVEFARNYKIKPVTGTEIRNGSLFCYILLAKNNAGFSAINRFLSEHNGERKAFPMKFPGHEEVFVIYPFGATAITALEPNEFIGVQSTEINKIFSVPKMLLREKFVVRQPVTFSDKTEYNMHRLLRAIDKNELLSKQDKKDLAEPHETFIGPDDLSKVFINYPELIENTAKVLDSCSIDMEFGVDKTKKVYGGSLADDKDFLRKLAMDGLHRRYGPSNRNALARVEKELAIIDKQEFNAYFLITWDILRYARTRDFFFVGRGSGANSIVAFCLDITDVDPIELDLYFERFLNPHRSSPPDFDIDFSWKDREEMTDYIFKRYGKAKVSLLGSYTTFQTRAVIRELGKVFGLPKEEIDKLGEGGNNLDEDKIQRQIRRYGSLLKDFPNHMSIHAGGVLISEEPIYQYSATEMPAKGFSTSQIDMFLAEKIGLFKLDILSQRGLGHIKETIEIVKRTRGISIDIRQVEKFKTDPLVAQQIRKADTIGCFYIESPAMRHLLKKLECDDYLTLVAASSIIRPGVSQSGMMRQYIYRYHNPDKFDYLHPVMEELLKETYGVMVYQEDVIKVAHHFAGLDLAEADVLRRAMSGKYRSHKEFER
ncbi:MAG: PHP domain-containing protein, partial [Chitinophagaceae bacterium]